MIGKPPFERSSHDEFFDTEVPGVEFSDCQSDAIHAARRNDGSNTAPVREPRIEDGFRFRDVVAQSPRNILNRDHQGFLAQMDTLHGFDESILFNKDAVGAVDHDLTDRGVEKQVLDGFEKREYGFESIHYSSPSASWRKYDLLTSL